MFGIIDAREVLTHTKEIIINKTRFIIATADKPGSKQMHQAMLTSQHNCQHCLTLLPALLPAVLPTVPAADASGDVHVAA